MVASPSLSEWTVRRHYVWLVDAMAWYWLKIVGWLLTLGAICWAADYPGPFLLAGTSVLVVFGGLRVLAPIVCQTAWLASYRRVIVALESGSLPLDTDLVLCYWLPLPAPRQVCACSIE